MMNPKNVLLTILFISMCIAAFHFTFARTGLSLNRQLDVVGRLMPIKAQTRNETHKERFERLVRTRNLDGLSEFMNELSVKQLPDTYDLLADICSAFNSYDFGDNRQYFFTRECSKNLLNSNDGLSPSLKLRLIRNLQGVEEYSSGLRSLDHWPADRSARIRLLFDLWQEFKEKLDPNFDVSDVRNRPLGNVPVPGPYMPGIKPQDIKEPEIRAKYLRAIAENKAKAERFNLQVQLHRMTKTLPEFIEKMLINLYGLDPIDQVEIEMKLRMFDLDYAAKSRVMTSISSKSKP
jgi:hypothetical protein